MVAKADPERLNKYGIADRRFLSKELRKSIRKHNTQIAGVVRQDEFICRACNGPCHIDRPNMICTDCENETHAFNGTRPVVFEENAELKIRLKKYGLSTTGYTRLLVMQGNVCAICKQPPAEVNGLVVDHNHVTGEVRGLLCSPCNTALGLFKDSPDIIDSAVAYLEEKGCYGPDACREDEA